MHCGHRLKSMKNVVVQSEVPSRHEICFALERVVHVAYYHVL